MEEQSVEEESQMERLSGDSVEYYEKDFDWMLHVLGKFRASDVEDDLKREMKEGDGGEDDRTSISAWATAMDSLTKALEMYYGKISEIEKDLAMACRLQMERESSKKSKSLIPRNVSSITIQTSPHASDEQGFASRAWDNFYYLHENKFFKERRYLLKLFPELSKPNICVLEVGAGHGSASLAILKQNPTARVFAIDSSQKAVSILQHSLQKRYPARFQAHRCDPTKDPLPLSIIGTCQVALCCFVLSAIPAGELEAILRRITNALTPFPNDDALILVRDYALFDMRMFKAIQNNRGNPWWNVPATGDRKLVCNAALSNIESTKENDPDNLNVSSSYRLLAPRTCLRQDGTLCLFFTPAVLRLLLLQSGCDMAHASLCCVNPPPGQHRIYINGRGIRKPRPNDSPS